MYEPDDNEEAISRIPLKNLGNSGLKVFRYKDNPEETAEDWVNPDNVLIGCLDEFSSVALVGIDKETGRFVFASSTDNVPKILYSLREFISYLEFSERLIRE
jgi:hypothetical protein